MNPDTEPYFSEEKPVKELLAELEELKIQNERLQQLVNIDGLTGVFNHRYFKTHLEREVSKTKRHKHPLSLVMCDIDYFKAFNDSFGHQVGDSVLSHFSKILQNNIRVHDVLARYGGEEFTIILSDTNLDGAYVVAEKLRVAVAEAEFEEDGQSFNVTASFGVSCSNDHALLSAKELIHGADHAMITAKNNGRNCTEVYRSGNVTVPSSSDFLHYAPQRNYGGQQFTIYIVDDETTNIDVLVNLLSDDYDLRVAKEGETLLKSLEKELPDLILLDIMMPGMNGYEVCSQLKRNPKYAHIPVIFLSAMSRMEDEVRGFSLGVFDYVTKPICPPTLKMRLKNCLNLQQYQNQLKELISLRSAELNEAQSAAIECMAAVAEYRNTETGSHIKRCGYFMGILAAALSKNVMYSGVLSQKRINLLCKSAPLHDIGKLGIPDRILLKEGSLTAEEFEIMKRHPVIGFEVLQIAKSQESDSPFLNTVEEIAYCHHERWDGSGYPRGLKGTEIPVSARLMAVIDVYDALTSERCYKSAMSHQDALDLIVASSGTHFDPDLIDALQTVTSEFLLIADEYRNQ